MCVIISTQISITTAMSSVQVDVNRLQPPPPTPPLSMPVWSLSCSTEDLLKQIVRRRNSVNDDENGDSSDDDNLQLPATSMNIVTFCSPVSVAAPKLWIVSLYYDTLTKDSFIASGRGILQLLRPCHKMLVPILGKRSGYEPQYSKRDECSALGFGWLNATLKCEHNLDTTTHPSSVELLPSCAAYINLKVINTVPAGDHLVTLCEVVETYQWDFKTGILIDTASSTTNSLTALDPTTTLYTSQLRQEGII
jgi:Flavin reductase like domain